MNALPLAVILLAQAASQSASDADQTASLSAMVDQFENQKDWSESDRLHAVDIAKQLNTRWHQCLQQAENHLQASQEPVETVTTAIMGACLSEQKLCQRAYASAFRGIAEPTERLDQARQIITNARSDAREEITAYLVASRLGKTKTP